jgi:hypothetical protein
MIAFVVALIPPGVPFGDPADEEVATGVSVVTILPPPEACAPSSSAGCAVTAAPQPGQAVLLSSICVPHFSQVIIRLSSLISRASAAFILD